MGHRKNYRSKKRKFWGNQYSKEPEKQNAPDGDSVLTNASSSKLDTCGKELKSKFLKFLHRTEKNDSSDSKACQTCGKTFLQEKNLMQHMKIHLKKPEEDDDCQIMDIPATPIPFIDISEDIVTLNNSDSAVSSTIIHEFESEDFEKSSNVAGLRVKRLPGFTIHFLDSIAVSPQKHPKPTTTHKSEEDIDGCQVMDIPASHIPSQGISEAIVTLNNSDLHVSSPSNHESNSEDLEETESNLKDVTERFTQTDEFSSYIQFVENKLTNYSERARAIVESLFNNVLLRADIGEFDKPPFV